MHNNKDTPAHIAKDLADLLDRQVSFIEQGNTLIARLNSLSAAALAASRNGDNPESAQPPPERKTPQVSETDSQHSETVSGFRHRSDTRNRSATSSETVPVSRNRSETAPVSRNRIETDFKTGTRILILNKIRTPVNRKRDPSFNLYRERFGTVTHISGTQIHFVTDNDTHTWRAAHNLRITVSSPRNP